MNLRNGQGLTKTYTYTARGLIDTVTDFRGGQTRYSYDALRRKNIESRLPIMRIGMFLLFVSIAFMGCRSGNKVVEHKQNAVALQKRIGTVVQSRVSEDAFIALLTEYNISFESIPATGFRSSDSGDLDLQEDEHVLSFTYYEFSWRGGFFRWQFVTKYHAYVVVDVNRIVRDVLFFESNTGL